MAISCQNRADARWICDAGSDELTRNGQPALLTSRTSFTVADASQIGRSVKLVRDVSDAGLVAVPETKRIFSGRGSKERQFLLQIVRVIGCRDGNGDLFTIPDNGDWHVLVGGQKK